MVLKNVLRMKNPLYYGNGDWDKSPFRGIKRLVNEGVLSSMDFTDFETCLDCINGKQTNKSKKGATRCKHLLEIIHTDICCPDMDESDLKYFIPFIDDYSRYMYLYMLHSKDKALEAFKVFNAKVEK